MALQGPIILIEDDANDIEVITTAFKELKVPNPIEIFTRAEDALAYLQITQEQPFIILCDIRLPGLDGLSMRKAIADDAYLCRKTIPFIFFTGVVSEDIVNEAYDLEVQGFYQKALNYTALKDQLYGITVYWKSCLHPNRSLAR